MTTYTQSITSEWLTDVLHTHGTLPQGRVVAVEQRGNDAFNSDVHLGVTYSEDAPSTAPQRLFLKRNIEAEWGKRAGAREVAFYKLVAPLAEQLPMIIHCYATEYDEASSTSYILLRDVSETHTPPVTRAQLIAYEGVPEQEKLAQVVDTVAQFHAFWWQHPLLDKDVTGMVQYYSDQPQAQKFWNSFIADEGTWFPTDLRALYEAYSGMVYCEQHYRLLRKAGSNTESREKYHEHAALVITRPGTVSRQRQTVRNY